MSFNELVYQLGKRYRQEREMNPDNEFPFFSGQIADVVDAANLTTLPELQGEYVIAYNDGQGTLHFIRVYIEDGSFEAEGTPRTTDAFSMSTEVDQIIDD